MSDFSISKWQIFIEKACERRFIKCYLSISKGCDYLCLKRGNSLLYRQITSFKYLGEQVRAKINDFKISLKQL